MVRIQTIIRDAGICSRRKAEELILEGRVTINGQVVTSMGQTADPFTDHIKVDGKLLRQEETNRYYYIFNKPVNVISTLSDPQDRPCLGDFIKRIKKNLFPVGRLDFDAEGLMILTNDGELAQKLTHPSSGVARTYLVKIQGRPEEEVWSKIRQGFSIGEGDKLGKINIKVIGGTASSTWVRIVLYEGKKNEIKRIFFRIRHPVRKIKRISFGPLKLGSLPVGKWRPMTASEIEKLLYL